MRARDLNKRIQFQRAVKGDDGLSKTHSFDDHGDPVWAKKEDLGDGERWRAGEVGAQVTTRFVVRKSSFTSDISPKDLITHGGLEYQIFGIKELKADCRFLEITTAARTDQND